MLGTRPDASIVPFKPDSIAIDAILGYVYIVDSVGDEITIVQNTRVVGTLPVGIIPQAISVNQVTGRAYVANHHLSITIIGRGAFPYQSNLPLISRNDP
jgi:DNA-binding beta-propeller fold protein YncE